MTIEYSEDNPFYELVGFLPPLDDSIQMLEKYVSDMAYHYERGFYNLSLFSFHYVYMAIIQMYLLKFHKFDRNIVNGQVAGTDPVIDLTPAVYSIGLDEKRLVKKFGPELPMELRRKHIALVDTRNDIAHFTGIVVPKDRIDSYIQNAMEILRKIQQISLDHLTMTPNNAFTNRISEISNQSGDNEKAYNLHEMIKDFYISSNDWKYLTNIEYINFGEYDDYAWNVVE